MKLLHVGGRAALAAAAILAALVVPLAADMRGTDILVVSQPRVKSVVYILVDKFQHGAGNQTFPLVTDGLQDPMGIAIDHNRQRLFVADVAAQKVFMYKLIFTQDEQLTTDGQQYVAVSGVTPRWVAVDDEGNVYCTDEQENIIGKVDEANVLTGGATPTTVYSGSSITSIASPGGIVADGTELFWGNKDAGTSKGSVVRGAEIPDKEDPKTSVHVLAKNAEKVYGVCASQNNIFYAGEAEFLYGVKKNNDAAGAASAATVSDIITKPRGCTWDGDGTVYVADKDGNAIFSFPSGMHTIGPAEVVKIFTLEDPYGVAVYRPPSRAERMKKDPAFLGGLLQGGANGASTVMALALPLLVFLRK